MAACYCGHSHEEHGHDPDYPGSTACSADILPIEPPKIRPVTVKSKAGFKQIYYLCDCAAYEADEDGNG